ncbi:MAG TPA: hypothetical protein VF862_15360 [Gemmatimonadales bacterium]
MRPFPTGLRSRLLTVAAVVAGPGAAMAQETNDPPPGDTTVVESFANTTAGEFTPAKGFQIYSGKRASLNVSFYALFRYLNQMPGDQTFTDHLDRERTVKARNDLNWHRTMIWFTGHFWDPRFRWNITAWTLGSTQQALLFGNLQYKVGKALTVAAGMAPNLTNRSMQGSFPFWAGSDRQMTEEFMRGGFASGFWITGQPLSRLYYSASVNTSLSQLGITASNDSRDLAFSGSLMWMPTTGEFGPRGGFGDLENHDRLATRFGASGAHAREYRGAPDAEKNNETQLRLSDGVYVFEADALADGVTVRYLDYDEFSVDAGAKYRGLSLQAEGFARRYSNFEATGPLPVTSLTDYGLQVQAGYMIVPKLVNLYGTAGGVWDDFERNPWELSGGVSVYPTGTRSWRLNLHVIRVERSPTGSNFGYYTAGQSGTTVSLGTDIIF